MIIINIVATPCCCRGSMHMDTEQRNWVITVNGPGGRDVSSSLAHFAENVMSTSTWTHRCHGGGSRRCWDGCQSALEGGSCVGRRANFPRRSSVCSAGPPWWRRPPDCWIHRPCVQTWTSAILRTVRWTSTKFEGRQGYLSSPDALTRSVFCGSNTD